MRVMNEFPELTAKYLYVSLTSHEAGALWRAKSHGQVPEHMLDALGRPVGRPAGRYAIYRLGIRGSQEAGQVLAWLRQHVAESEGSDARPRRLTRQAA